MKMRRTIAILTLFVAAFYQTGCASTKARRLSGTQFVEQARRCNEISSFNWTTYVGNTHQRAYLEYGHPAFFGSGLKVTIYWTSLSELPDHLANQMKAGISPWKSIHKELDKKELEDNKNMHEQRQFG